MGAPRPAGLLWRSLLLLGLLVAARCDAGPGSDAWCEDLDWCDCCNDEGSWNVRLRGGADLFDVHTGGDASWPPAGGPANASDACRDVVLFTAHTQAPGERATRFDFAAPGAGLGGNATAELTFPELVHVVNCGYAALHGHGFQFVPVAAGTSRSPAWSKWFAAQRFLRSCPHSTVLALDADAWVRAVTEALLPGGHGGAYALAAPLECYFLPASSAIAPGAKPGACLSMGEYQALFEHTGWERSPNGVVNGGVVAFFGATRALPFMQQFLGRDWSWPGGPDLGREWPAEQGALGAFLHADVAARSKVLLLDPSLYSGTGGLLVAHASGYHKNQKAVMRDVRALIARLTHLLRRKHITPDCSPVADEIHF